MRRIAGPARLGGLSVATGGTVTAVDLPVLDYVDGDASFGVPTSLPLVSTISGTLMVNAA